MFHLLDLVGLVHDVETALDPLVVDQQVELPVPDRPASGQGFTVVEVPCDAFTSSIRVLREGVPLEARNSREELQEQPGYLLVPATRRISFRDLRRQDAIWHRGDRHGPAHLGMTAASSASEQVIPVADRLVLRVLARAVPHAKEARLVVRVGSTEESISLPDSRWTTHETRFETPPEAFSIELTSRGEAPRGTDELVQFQWIELFWPEHDRVLIHDPEEKPLTLTFSPLPPMGETQIALPRTAPFRTTFVRAGGPATLRIDGAVGRIEVDDLVMAPDAALDLGGLAAGLHTLEVDQVPDRIVLEQPLSQFTPLLLDPNLALELPPSVASAGNERLGRLAKIRKRLECCGDRRASLLLARASHVDYRLELGLGDRIRYSVGGHDRLPDLHPLHDPPPSATFRVRFQPDGSSDWRVLDETGWSLDGSPWLDRSVEIGIDQVGTGTLRFETLEDGGSPLWTAAVADPRIVRVRRAVRPKPNVLLYLVDTLRSDHLSCYGHGNPTSPTLDRIAQEGYLFENCYAVASWTRPSVGSIFSGVYPRYHGAAGNHGATLSTAVVTLTETLADAGYSTWAMVSNNQVAARGLAFEQGFHRFVGPGGLHADPGELTSRHIHKTVAPWLEDQRDEPFFLYLHSLDPHGPYHPPLDYFDRFTGDYDGPLREQFLDPIRVLRPLTEKLVVADVDYVRGVYDAAIRYQDDQFEQLFNLLRRLDVLDNTIVLIVSDHGEEFMEHGDWDHSNRMWEELVRVPMIVWVPEGLRESLGPPRRIPDPVSHVDIAPGLFDLLGIDDLGARHGRSFLDLLRGAEAAPRTLYAQEGNRGMVLRGSDKLIWHQATKRTTELQLFDLAVDPREAVNRVEGEPEVVRELLGERERLEAEFDETASHLLGTSLTVELDEEARRQLILMGYMDEDE